MASFPDCCQHLRSAAPSGHALKLSQQIDHKTANLLLMALHTASTNLGMTNFKPTTNDVTSMCETSSTLRSTPVERRKVKGAERTLAPTCVCQ